MSEIYQKLESAICSYLIQYVAGDLTTNPSPPASWFWPESLRNDAGSYRIFGGESDQTKDGQAILVIAEDANQEEPQFSGNFMVPIQIWLRTPVKVLNAKETTELQATALANHQAAAANLSDAMNQDPFTLAFYFNSSGQNVTVMGGIMDLKPQRSEMPNYFASGWSFRVYAMNRVAA